MSDEEFSDERRRMLIIKLQQILPNVSVSSTAWGCLWLSDLTRLQEVVAEAERDPVSIQAKLAGVEDLTGLVPTCKDLLPRT